MSKKVSRRQISGVLIATALAAGAAWLNIPLLGGLGGLALWLLAPITIAILLWLAWRKLLWRVSSRLAFSYLLIGVLPIALLFFLLLVSAYLLSGMFLGHMLRTSMSSLYGEVVLASSTGSAQDMRQIEQPGRRIVLARYQNGSKVSGAEAAPEVWPVWLVEETRFALDDPGAIENPPLIVLDDGRVTLAAASGDEQGGVMALLEGNLQESLTERSRVWVEMVRRDDPNAEGAAIVQLFETELTFEPLRSAERREELEAFFGDLGIESRFLIIGLETAGSLYSIDSGDLIERDLTATIFAPPAAIAENLFSSSAGVQTVPFFSFFLVAFLLFDIYIVAAVMALFLIFGLSHAVNQLSRATSMVQEGDFSFRIPDRRKDQLGALQRSFNEMTANLGVAVEEATQKEILDKELEIARSVQQSLLPEQLELDESVDVASYFEPSAVIGGDYYDLLPLDETGRRLAVVIADVSGHGVSAGLRMAMIKAALDILVREHDDASYILQSLDKMVRSSGDRSFVTAVYAVLDLEEGTVEITNAGHPPTYLIREGSVSEVLLEGPPLGALGRNYGQECFGIKPGDTLVWMSDGLIEATDESGNMFGYERTAAALNGGLPGSSSDSDGDSDSDTEIDGDCAKSVRDRFIAAVQSHSGEQPADDDRTMVVLRYLGPGGESEEGPSAG